MDHYKWSISLHDAHNARTYGTRDALIKHYGGARLVATKGRFVAQ